MLPELKIKFGLQFGIFFTFSNIRTIITNPHFRQFNSIEKRLPPAGENFGQDVLCKTK